MDRIDVGILLCVFAVFVGLCLIFYYSFSTIKYLLASREQSESTDQAVAGITNDSFEVQSDLPKYFDVAKEAPLSPAVGIKPPTYKLAVEFKDTPLFHRSLSAPAFSV